MDTIDAYIPQDIYSMLTTGLVVLVVLWLVTFIVRKLVGVALALALVFGTWMVWHDPALLQRGQDLAFSYYDQWRFGQPPDDEGADW